MSSKDAPTPDIMNVREIIEYAFGDFEDNTVNFKLVQTVLFLIARQLRLLERRVEVVGPLTLLPSDTTLSVTEVKIHAMQKKKKKGKPSVAGAKVGEAGTKSGMTGAKPGGTGAKPGVGGAKAGDGGSLRGKKTGRGAKPGSTDKSSSDKTSTDKTSTDKTSTDKTSTDKTSTDKTSTDKTSTDKTPTDKTSTYKTSTDKTFTDKTSTGKTFADKTSTDKASTDRTTSSGEKTSTDKTSSGEKTTSSGEKTYTDKTSSGEKTTSSGEKTSTGKTSSGGKTTSSGEKTSTDITTSGEKTTSSGAKTSTDITSEEKTTPSGAKTSTDKTSSGEKTTSSGEKTSTDITTSGEKRTSSGEKTSTDITTSGEKTTSSGEKTSTDKTSSGEKTTSSGEKTSTDITTSGEKTTSSGDKTSTDKTSSSEKTTSSGAKTSTYKTSSGEKTTSSGEKTSTDKTSSGEKTTSSGEKTSTDKTSSGEKTTSSGAKTSTDQTTSTDKTTSGKTTSSDRISTDKTSSSRFTSSSKDSGKTQKRTDSFDEGAKVPTPMASVSSTQEAQYEKLLVVKKVPSKEARAGESAHGQKRTPQISVVTQEQFEQMADAVRKLEKKFLPVGMPGFPEHAELMEELRRGASLTDAMAALQLSARLEATEKSLAQMMSMVTELALQTPGVELDRDTRAYLGKTGATGSRQRGIYATSELSTSERGTSERGISERDGLAEGGRSTKGRKVIRKAKEGISAPSRSTPFKISETAEPTRTETQAPSSQATDIAPTGADALGKDYEEYVTYLDLHAAARELYDELVTKVKTVTSKISSTAENAFKLSTKLEARLNATANVSSRMVDLENAVKLYSEQINALDTGLSSQMTNYQEQLTQMQHDLEVGLDNMAEVFGNTGGDVEAMTELHSHFISLQVELDNMGFRQRELKDAQNSTAYDLENLWKEIEMLRDTKSDREEVTDALRDKAGISELNGLVSLQQFDAVRGDFEKRIGEAYDTFNNQEYVWQKAIEEMMKLLYAKANWIQVTSLKDDIQKYLNKLSDRMQIIADIVGEPKSAMLSKKVFRDTCCLACGSPAKMDLEEKGKVPALPKFPSARQPAEGAEAESKTTGGGDNRPCYPDLPIPHPKDPRSHICKRYCGGSHTTLTEGLNRAPQSLVVHAQRPFNAALGTDGKLYMVDEEASKIPCLPCNLMPKPKPVTPKPDPQNKAPIDSIDADYSLTPAAHEFSYN